ncbi:hypothetical protein CUC15_09690 [Oceanobacillus zhaokaii]|uniref:DUF4062 domain-containing protein n=1 Tax=Oceanobacillus zhaokaii TaxID=2052660 RepID=A0A345PGQ2_9BACI|nr:hypothetical protein CUC15_09690 [Oceanobacillus zhaokaii]
MEKKLQVFVSSTFTDLQEERQSAVSSILNAGHIPAGMELFKAGDESQKETIKRWIEESDVYMLILGGRYGTIDEESGKSYTHWEYDYAGELGKPRFAIVIDEDALEEKSKVMGSHVMERENYKQYKEFREEVLGKISKFYSDIKDIKLTVLESLKEYERNDSLTGWISGKDIGNYEEILKENHGLLKENNKLKREKEKLAEKLNKENEIDGFSYKEIKEYLNKTEIQIPEGFIKNQADFNISLAKIFLNNKDDFAVGVENRADMSTSEEILFYLVAPKLMFFSLVEKIKLTSVRYERIQLSKYGNKFIAMYEMEKLIEDNKVES